MAGVGGPNKVDSSRLERMTFVNVFRPVSLLVGLVYTPVDVTNTLKSISSIIPILEQGGEVKAGVGRKLVTGHP